MKQDAKLLSKTVEFLQSIGHEITVEDLEKKGATDTEWTHAFPFVEV